MTALSIKKKGDRAKLEARREPYWEKIEPGQYLGFRRGPDTWIARHRAGDGKQNYKALEVPRDGDEFIAAKKVAAPWFEQMRGALSRARRGTVAQALAAYIEQLRRHGRAESAKVTERCFKVIVPETDPLAALRLEDATREDFELWRARLLPGRHIRSVNRYVGSLAAGLNASLELGFVGDARTWTLKVLTDDSDHDDQTAVFLTPKQRKALIASATPHAADFFRGLELTGARPGELARATVADFDGQSIRFTHRKGRSAKLRTRYTVLSAEGVEFFKRMAKGKFPAAALIGNFEGRAWPRQSWGDAMRNAITAHHKDCRPQDVLPEGTSAYSFRHSRISELLQIHGIDPLTTAWQTGTSVAQIEKTYFKFISHAFREKLSAVREAA